MRNIVIGDVHSGLRGLQQLFQKIEPATKDQFIFLGDYVDGWSDAAETVSFLLDFSKSYPCVFIRGNHDYLMHQYLKYNDTNPMWLAHGGEESKTSYDAVSFSEKERHLNFFENLTNFYIDSQNRLFVHAGFTNLKGPKYEHFSDLVFWDRTLWEMARGLDTSIKKESNRYPERLKQFKEIYIGHTPVTRIGATTPLNFANVWNIDTGAAFKGPLTAFDIDTKEFWQSDPVYSLYPNEKGRN